MTDQSIIERVHAGDVEAFAVLVDRYYPACHRYAVYMLLDPDDAEDVVQECFIRAYRALPRYRDRGRFKGWLFRILLNRCRSVTARRRPAYPPGAGTDRRPATGGPVVEPDADAILSRDEIWLALAGLPAILREAFLLRHVEELSYEEMAEMTGRGVSALKMRVNRACTALRGALEEAFEP